MKKKKFLIGILLVLVILLFGACGSKEQNLSISEVDFNDLTCTKEVSLSYAKQVTIKKYGEYTVLSMKEGDDYLLVPEKKVVPKNLPKEMVVLQQPFSHTYLVSTSVMDFLRQLDVISMVSFSGTKQEDWAIQEAKKAMKDGSMEYAGKYNAPDYELLLKGSCNLAIENTMIFHNPETKEKLEELGIPIFVERSSYEESPMGRLEWIKVYGLLFGKEKQADEFFKQEVAKLQKIKKQESSKNRKTVAYFYMTSSRQVNVRKPNDYISKMISLGGGKYCLTNLPEAKKNALSTMNMQMEDFYLQAKNADILIYNSTIDGELKSVKDLLAKDASFSDFKAVKKGNVYCTTNNFFQQITDTAQFIEDLHQVCESPKSQNMKFLKKLAE